MEREFDREDYGLRVLIETMQTQGRTGREIEAAVREASGQWRPAERRPSRHLLRFARPRRARKRAEARR